MYTISAKGTPDDCDVFRNGKLMASPKSERELELRLNFHGILEGFCRDFIRKLKETGSATEEMPTIDFRQIPCSW